MSQKAKTSGRPAVRDGEAGTHKIYRGVRLQPLAGRTRYTGEEIRRAIDTAIKKNPDAFAKGS